MTAVVAFIFARGGSKGLPGKNIKFFNGKPLIAWAIEVAYAVKCVERVIVSTDCEEIASVARQFGANVPFLRPQELSNDTAPEWLAWQHALHFLKDSDKGLPKVMISVPATAPLRKSGDIESCLNRYNEGDVDGVVAVTSAHHNPYFNMVKENMNGTIQLLMPTTKTISRRQDVPKVYDLTTVCYVMSPEFVISSNSIFDGRIGFVEVPAERAIDIDTALDFQIAEHIFKTRSKDG